MPTGKNDGESRAAYENVEIKKNPMAKDYLTDNPELEALYRKYENAPDSHVFAPLADAYRKAGMLEEARTICDKGVEKHPQYASGYVVQGKCYYDLEQREKSERAFRKVLELDQNNLVALKYLGLILLERGEKHSAMEHFKHVLALDPDNKEIKIKLEDLVVDTEESPNAADRGFQGEPISLGDEDETPDDLATTTLADIYADQGYLDKAKKIYQEILRRQPHNEVVKNKLKALEVGGFTRLETSDHAVDENRDAENGANDAEKRHKVVDPVGDETGAEDFVSEDESPISPPRKVPTATEKASGRPIIDENKSYQQFKRWLKNLTE